MDPLSFKTTFFNNSTTKTKKMWVVMDAENQYLGRFSSQVALRIRGKHKSIFSPHVDCGDHVIVINSEKIKLSGKKWINKKYIRYTGFPGGRKIVSVKNLFKKDPRILIYKAVKGMIPKNRLGRKIIKNLHVYYGSKHNYQSQKPVYLK
ncbi:50S ribosomal protein L13 [Blattabacterium cuenoti]|uniref:50S ribosomal protein L13 n=1 Tax=Blattabacterium cuenoti TaxID=1653831 RepID=UPI00163BCCAB|nr:50S ribosomal protein L13 [Blattabacterium cuenoti]